MIILEVIYNTIMIIFKIFTIYFSIIVILGYIKGIIDKKKIQNKDKKIKIEQLKYAVLVPARNEEKCISNIITSIKNQDYPSELIDLYILPNNCTDNTKEVSEKLGAYTLDIPKEVKNKAGALSYAVDELIDKDYDAFIVFDSDNKASKNFITEFNKEFNKGANIVKSKIFAQKNDESIIACLYDIHFSFANCFINRPRNNLGMSVRIVGTGFGVSNKFLKQEGGFNVETITEDVEFYVLYTLKGEKAVFAEKAVTYDEQPTKFSTTLIQRKRWVSGIMQVFIFKLKDILKGIFKFNINAVDIFMQLGFTYLQAFLPFLLIFACVLYKQAYIEDFLSLILTGYVSAGLIGILVLIIEKRIALKKNIILGIIIYPIFVVTFIPLQTISLFKKTKVWREIEHKGEEECGKSYSSIK